MKSLTILVVAALALTACGSTSAPTAPAPGTTSGRRAPACAIETVASPAAWALGTASGDNARAYCRQAVSSDSPAWALTELAFTTAPPQDIAGAERQSHVVCTDEFPVSSGQPEPDGTPGLPASSTGVALSFYGTNQTFVNQVCFDIAAGIGGVRNVGG